MPLVSITSSHCGLLAGHIIFQKILSAVRKMQFCVMLQACTFLYSTKNYKNQYYHNNLSLIIIIMGGPPYYPPMGPLPGSGLSCVALSLHLNLPIAFVLCISLHSSIFCCFPIKLIFCTPCQARTALSSCTSQPLQSVPFFNDCLPLLLNCSHPFKLLLQPNQTLLLLYYLCFHYQ